MGLLLIYVNMLTQKRECQKEKKGEKELPRSLFLLRGGDFVAGLFP